MITKTTLLLSAALVLGAMSNASALNLNGDDSGDSAFARPHNSQVAQGGSHDSYASAPSNPVRRAAPNTVRRVSPMSSYDVYDMNRRIGADPDAQIRSELARDPEGRRS